MTDNTLGRLIRTSPDLCPECGEHKLQLRAIVKGSDQKGIALSETIVIKQCPLCYYEEESGQKKRKEKVALRDTFVVVKEVSKNDKYSKRGTTSRNTRSDSRRSTGRNRR